MKSITEFFRVGMDRDLVPLVFGPPGGVILNLGAGNKKSIPEAIPLDYPDWDAEVDPIPHTNGSVSTIHAYHFLEHITNVVGVLQDCQRVLMPGGVLNICVPYYSAQMAVQDLDHKHHFFCEETWKLTFHNEYHNIGKRGWEFDIGFNVIMGIFERNLCLLTQLIRR